MKQIVYGIFILTAFLLPSCSTKSSKSTEAIKKDIMNAEKDFEKMAAEKGIAEAFGYYADSNAVIKRSNDTLITGKENIRNYYSGEFYKTAKVNWTPDFVEVSEKGDMAWTYGKYLWISTDSSGKTEEFKGVFHTVWKKQVDRSWKYVWD